MIWIWIWLLSNAIYLIPPSLHQNLSWEWNDQCELCHRLSINPSGSAILVLWFLPPFVCCYQTRLRLLTPNWVNVISDLAQGQKSVPVLPWIVSCVFVPACRSWSCAGRNTMSWSPFYSSGSDITYSSLRRGSFPAAMRRLRWEKSAVVWVGLLIVTLFLFSYWMNCSLHYLLWDAHCLGFL